MDFYKTLNYSFGNEDWYVEKEALQISPGDTALCVTASGDRPLHLLLAPCKKVISIDVNPIQTALLELKMVIFDRLDYQKSLAFLGCSETPHRLNIYNEIKSELSENARNYWDQMQKQIRLGVIYQGRTEKLCRLASKILNLSRKEKNRKLFNFDDIEKQRKFVDEVWNSPGLCKVFEILFRPSILKYLSKDPGITAYTEYTENPGKHLYEKMINYLRYHLARKSALIQIIFQGHVNKEAYLPYLTYDGYEIIRKRLSLIEFQTDNIVQYLETLSAKSVNCFSMSDIASYMPQSAFEMLLQKIKDAAAPNARFSLREVFSKRYIPQELTTSFMRDHQLEQKLEQEESNFVYRFIAGKII